MTNSSGFVLSSLIKIGCWGQGSLRILNCRYMKPCRSTLQCFSHLGFPSDVFFCFMRNFDSLVHYLSSISKKNIDILASSKTSFCVVTSGVCPWFIKMNVSTARTGIAHVLLCCQDMIRRRTGLLINNTACICCASWPCADPWSERAPRSRRWCLWARPFLKSQWFPVVEC